MPLSAAIGNVNRIVAGGLVALFFALIFGALAVFGVISMALGHVFLGLAWAVGSLLICTEIIPGRPTHYKLVSTVVLAVLFSAGDVWIIRIKAKEQPASIQKDTSGPIPHTEPNKAEPPSTAHTQATTSAPVPTKPFDPFLSPEHARMSVTSIEGARSDSFPYIINVTTSNKGSSAADEVAGWWKAVPATNEVDEQTLRSYQDEILRSPALTSRMAESKGREIEPGGVKVFTIPDLSDPQVAASMLSYFRLGNPNKRIYILYVTAFRDRLMPPNVRGVTEHCGWILGNQSLLHDCGRSRSYLEKFTP
jgi:hypothetical protein